MTIYYLFKVCIVSLYMYVCFVTALFSASIIISSVIYVTILSLQGSIVSLSACYVIALFSAAAVSSPVCNVSILFLQDFHCSIFCLLRHKSQYYSFKVSIVSLSACYILPLFSTLKPELGPTNSLEERRD